MLAKIENMALIIHVFLYVMAGVTQEASNASDC
jgi:hypothetical protein